MKLNFWQWLGVVLLVIGGIMWFNKRKPVEPNPTPAPQVAPAPSPATTTGPATAPAR